jgi:ATP-dependent Lon protease
MTNSDHSSEPINEIPESAASKVSDDMLIIVPVRNLVLFPGTVVPVAINRERSLAAAQEAVRAERKVGFLLQQDPDLQSPTGRDLHKVGTAASIVRYVTGQDGTHHLVVQGERRFRVLDWQSGLPFMVARVEFLPDSPTTSEIEARALNVKRLAAEAVALLPQAPAELANAIQSVESPSTLADLISSFMDVKSSDKQQLLETLDLKARLDHVTELLTKRIEVLRLQRQLEEQTRDAIDERHKEALLREQLHQIRKELGEEGESGEEIAELR